MDPRALTELLPKWKEDGAPLNQPVTADRFLFLSETGARATPAFFLPDCFKNHGNYVISLGNVVKWLATQAEALGVEIFPGFPAAEVLYDESGAVKGVATGNLGIGKDGEPTADFQLGMELHAKYTIFAEGSRGSLGRQLIERFKLDAGKDPQSYAIGLKRAAREIDAGAGQARPRDAHRSPAGRYGRRHLWRGSFLGITSDHNQVELGFVVGLDYSNPYLSPFEEIPALEAASGDSKGHCSKAASASATARVPSPPAAC